MIQDSDANNAMKMLQTKLESLVAAIKKSSQHGKLDLFYIANLLLRIFAELNFPDFSDSADYKEIAKL